MTDNTKRKLLYWGGGIALFAFFFGGSIRQTIGMFMYMRQQQVKPSPVGQPTPAKQPVAPASPTKQVNLPVPGAPTTNGGNTPAVADPPFERVTGVWEGIGNVPPNSCTLKLEIRPRKAMQPGSRASRCLTAFRSCRRYSGAGMLNSNSWRALRRCPRC